MAKPETPKERRKSRRVQAQLALQISERGREPKRVVTESINISTGGVYCLVKTPVPVLTVLDLSIQLPRFAAYKSTQVVHCEGVVVRCEKSPGGARGAVRYDLACAFQNLDEETRGLVNEFVLWKLLGMGAGRSG
ncbi:MAG TPA: PilZ domain-containing protein [Candidatus Saccharimonadales bacterium]|nr:PilZ domain-containing protein [Candidatus Saccharimonadales bacterium]